MHIQSEEDSEEHRRTLGGEGGGHGGLVGVLYPSGEGERNKGKEHLTVWLVSQRVLWLL